MARLGAEGRSLKFCCWLLGVAPSGFLRWRSKPPSARDIGRAWGGEVIVRVWEASRRTYGKRPVRAELEDACGEVADMRLVTRVMREHGISGLPRRRRRKPSGSNRYTASDLVNRAFDRDRPNQLPMTDITEHPAREGKLCCCVVLDAFSRRAVGWPVDPRATTATADTALGTAIDNRSTTAETLIHTDHGPPNTSWTFSPKVRSAGLVPSIGTAGDAYDNAAVEPFRGTTQTELLNRKHRSTRIEPCAAIDDRNEALRNRRRRHPTPGNMSPIDHQRRQQHQAAA